MRMQQLFSASQKSSSNNDDEDEDDEEEEEEEGKEKGSPPLGTTELSVKEKAAMPPLPVQDNTRKFG